MPVCKEISKESSSEKESGMGDPGQLRQASK